MVSCVWYDIQPYLHTLNAVPSASLPSALWILGYLNDCVLAFGQSNNNNKSSKLFEKSHVTKSPLVTMGRLNFTPESVPSLQ